LAQLLLYLYRAELPEQYQVLCLMPRSQNRTLLKANIQFEETPPLPTALLLSDDQALIDLVFEVVKHPWSLIHCRAAAYLSREAFAQPNVRLVVLDDQAVDENSRGMLLTQIRRRFAGTPLLYVAATQSEGIEKRARTNGAHYYASKPLSFERFGYVLRSFLRAQQIKH
jgi:DNA-binding response OmpR family regulator